MSQAANAKMPQQINLFNPDLLKQKQLFTSGAMLGALGALLVAAIGLSVFARHNISRLEAEEAMLAERLNKTKLRQAQAMVEFAPRGKNADLQQQIDTAQQGLRSLHEIELILNGGTLGGAQGYAEYFRALARQSSGELWLTGLSIEGAGNQIGLSGRALSADAVPAYISRLTREPVLQGKTFGSLQITRPQLPAKPDTPAQDAPFIEFTLRAEGGERNIEVTP